MKSVNLVTKRALEILLLIILTLINYFVILMICFCLGFIAVKIAPSVFTVGQESFLLLDLLIFIPFILALSYSLLCLTPFSSWMIRKLEGFKPLNPSANYRISLLIEDLQITRKLKTYIINSDNAHIVGVGKNNIGFSPTVLNEATDEEIKAGICHVSKYFQLGDNRYTTIFYAMMQLGSRSFYIIFWTINLLLRMVFGSLSYVIPRLRNFSRLVVKFWRAIYLLFFNMIYISLFIVYATISRRHQYLCDKHVADKGYADALISVLERMKPYEQSTTPISYADYVSSLHPTILKRIFSLQNSLDLEEDNI